MLREKQDMTRLGFGRKTVLLAWSYLDAPQLDASSLKFYDCVCNG
jgi:hypothetical protein